MLKNNKKSFWIANISTTKDVSIDDLRVTVRKGRSVNLLSKNYNFTEEQIKDSFEKGSIKKKSNVLKVRVNAPVIVKTAIDIVKKPRILTKLRHAQVLEEKSFEELSFGEDVLSNVEVKAREEALAAEQAEIDFQDRAPLLAVEEKYVNPEEEE